MLISQLLNPEAQRFIQQSWQIDPSYLLLKYNDIAGVPMSLIIQQIVSKRKAEKKLPTWFSTETIIYPPPIAIEQTSSELTAAYKALLFSGNHMLDLCCGFGVDSFYFSRSFKQLMLCDLNPLLINLIKHNYTCLNLSNYNAIAINGIEYLQTCQESYDLIYIDPSRRNDKRKVFLIEDCTPNILAHFELFFKYTNQVLIKFSPMLDLAVLLNKLPYIYAIHLIAVKNEMKELLVHLDKTKNTTPLLHCTNLASDQMDFVVAIDQKSPAEFAVHIGNFLYEPNVAILKSGFFNTICTRFDVQKLAEHTHLYTTEHLIDKFPGKTFSIKQIYHSKDLHRLKNGKFNIVTKNFPMKPDKIKAKYQLKDGGNQYLFFTSFQNKKIILLCERI